MLKVALQLPAVAGPEFDALGAEAFLIDRYRDVRRAISEVGGVESAVTGPAWVQAVAGARSPMRKPVRASRGWLSRHCPRVRAATRNTRSTSSPRMLSNVTGRQIRTIKARLQRINPIEQPDEHARLFGELISLESYHRGLRERANGG